MVHWATRLLLLAPTFVFGCGSSSADAPSGGGGGPAGDGTGGAGAAVCDAFQNAPAQTVMSVTLENHRATPIFVTTDQTCFSTPPFTLVGPNGQGVSLGVQVCESNCAEQMKPHPTTCPLICQGPPLIRIEAAGSHSVQWGPSVLETTKMPLGCYFDSLYIKSCQRIVALDAGTYTFEAKAATECTGCVCTPDTSGSCAPANGTLVGPWLEASASADLPTGNVELVFE